MARYGLTLAFAVGLIAAAGCGGGSKAAHQSGTTRHYSIVVQQAEPDWDAPLPPNLCFVASRNYEVEITARSERRHTLCDWVAATYLPHEARLRWPPPYLRDPDSAPSVVCVLGHGPDRLEIDYGPADSGRLDAESICDALVARGWKRRSVWEALDW